MLKKIILLVLILLGLSALGYYVLYTQGAFQTKEDIYSDMPAMKCEAGKCGGAMEKTDTNKVPPAQKCVSGGKCAAGKCGNN